MQQHNGTLQNHVEDSNRYKKVIGYMNCYGQSQIWVGKCNGRAKLHNGVVECSCRGELQGAIARKCNVKLHSYDILEQYGTFAQRNCKIWMQLQKAFAK